jgi:hypothetical protein
LRRQDNIKMKLKGIEEDVDETLLDEDTGQ